MSGACERTTSRVRLERRRSAEPSRWVPIGGEHEMAGCREHRPLAEPGKLPSRWVSERDHLALAALWTRLLTRRVATLDVDALRLEVDVPSSEARAPRPSAGRRRWPRSLAPHPVRPPLGNRRSRRRIGRAAADRDALLREGLVRSRRPQRGCRSRSRRSPPRGAFRGGDRVLGECERVLAARVPRTVRA
jgi:hypothetical protein